jgi:hypothetical protein
VGEAREVGGNHVVILRSAQVKDRSLEGGNAVCLLADENLIVGMVDGGVRYGPV